MLSSGTPRRAFWFFKGTVATAQSLKIRWLEELQAECRREAVNLFHVQFAHEIDRFSIDQLAGNHNGESRGVGNHEVSGDQIGTFLEATIDFRTGELYVLALFFSIGSEEGRAHVSLAGYASRIVA